ncbi:uncharacterized protein BXZ73DRAFT_99930 [Epithele typhae]|uniref:uncharacterized protein n=1 Tax=Epithele typhae TaxID=378194 RepID=UPI0020086C91|nr:uncharacterized protein BXZ73DRAFT_99930 [Epithele typhae]KAH9938868.1 hypothetical protein BXZ73DRAFT_99930 [Epithele typhae]
MPASTASYANPDALSLLGTATGVLNTQTVVTNVLVTFLYGVVTILSAVCLYLLRRKGFKQRSTKFLFGATILLYISTSFHWATNVAYMLSFNHLVASAAADVGVPTFSIRSMMLLQNIQRHATPTALTVNMFVGDVIVWWRALVVWPGQKMVRCFCGICLLVATLGLTFMSIISASVNDVEMTPNSVDMVSSFFSGLFGALSALLTLTTNFAATAMIGYKTLQHRSFLKRSLGRRARNTQVLKVMILLVESGAIYCGMWIFVVVYAFMQTFGGVDLQKSASGWYTLSYYLTNGCLIPLVAIYPMVIMILVSLNKSQVSTVVSAPRFDRSNSGTARASATIHLKPMSSSSATTKSADTLVV